MADAFDSLSPDCLAIRLFGYSYILMPVVEVPELCLALASTGLDKCRGTGLPILSFEFIDRFGTSAFGAKADSRHIGNCRFRFVFCVSSLSFGHNLPVVLMSH